MIRKSLPLDDPSCKAQLLVSQCSALHEHDIVLFTMHEGERAITKLRTYDFAYEIM